MDYERLSPAYLRAQVLRVRRSLEKIRYGDSSQEARVIPSEENLVLGTGRPIRMAIMFLDISNFSMRAAETASEQLTLLVALNFFFTEMIRIAEDYGGTVEKNTGDGLMAYFEDSGREPPENGAKRAVACALTMMSAGQWLINPILDRSGLEPIKFRITIEHGSVTIARLGAPRRFNAVVAVGTTANLASKMLSVAKAGQILLGNEAKHQLPHMWQVLWTVPSPDYSGWVYRESDLPYQFHLYTGRWTWPLRESAK